MHLVSLKNPRVKQVVRLRDRRGRDREERMIIEGYRCLRRALANHVPIDELYVCEELFQGENEQALISALAEQGATVFTTTEPVFRKMAYRDRPEGLLGLAPQLRRSLADLPDSAPPPLYLVAEAIEKPGNLGTMLRTCDATGVTGLILCDPCTDLFNPNVVRASTGSVFSVPVAEATADEAFAWLANGGVRVLAATPHADRLYTEVDLSGPLAIAVGAEQYGLSQEWLDRADLQVRIPMLGQADSLNVATATALLLYEAVRQRMEAGVVARPREVPNAH